MKTKKLNIIIAGGGTGGHIFPAIAIANAFLKTMEVEILFVGAKGKMEMEKVPQAGFKIIGIDIAGFNRSSLLKNISLPWKLIKSFLEVQKVFNSFSPDAVIGVGGYSSFPVLRYAQWKGIPSFIHESNSYAGKSNKFLGKRATKVFVATDEMEKFFPKEKLVITGNPVRRDIEEVSHISKTEALKHFGLEAGHTLLVIGGSLGARSINESVAEGLNRLLDAGLQVIWQTGKVDATKWKNAAAENKKIYVSDFITDMRYAYAAADIVVSRAGAMAIAELCIVQKPVVFVPYPYAAEDHQTVNAINLVKKDAALIVEDAKAKADLIDTVVALAKDEKQQKQLSENIGHYKQLNADERIVLEMINALTAA